MKTLEELREEYRELKDKSAPLLDLDPAKMTEAQATELRTITRAMKSTADLIEQALLEERNKPGYIPSGITLDPNDQAPETRGGPARDKTYRGMFFPREEIPKSEFKNADEFLSIVASGLHDGRLKRTFTEGVPSAGGFSVPEPVAAEWLDASLQDEVVRPLATVWPMDSASRSVPSWDSMNRSDGSAVGGLKMQWLGEAATATAQTGKLRKIRLEAKKGAIFVDASSELVEDGLGFESQLQLALQKSMAYAMDYSFLMGSGAGQPLGCLMGSDVIEVAKEGGQAADSIDYQNILKMYSAMWNGGRKNAVWIANHSCIPWLMQLSIPIGTAGAHIPVLKEESGKMSILGRPLYLHEGMAALGDVGDIAFCDFSQYYVGLRREMAIDKSIAPGWLADTISYRILMRFDGQSTWSSPLTPAKGTTQSPFVTLATR